MKAEEFKNLVREIIREELQNTTNEDEYDRWRDSNLDRNPMWGMNRGSARNPVVRYTAKDAMFAQKIKYKNPDGSEGEATVKTLLGYPKDHPGRKLAARAYAQFMKGPYQKEEICEGEGCLDEKSVPQPYNRKSPPRRPMTKSQIEKRKKIGRNMMSNEKIVSKFRKKHGDDWKDYLWAAATSATFRQRGTTKSDDKRKK